MNGWYLSWGFFATIVHYVVPFAIVYWGTRYNPWHAFFAGGIMDFDVALADFGIVAHRGPVHTPTFLLVLTALAIALRARHSVVFGIWVGGLTHLVVDTASGWGIMWLWPLSTEFYKVNLRLNSMKWLTLMVVVGIVIWILVPDRERYETLSGRKKGKRRP